MKLSEIYILYKSYTNIHLCLYIISHVYKKNKDDKLQLNNNFIGGY